MRTSIQTILLTLAVVVSVGFSTPGGIGLKATYGVSESDPSHISLTLHEDFTFEFQDLSDRQQEIIVRGIYQLKNRRVLLEASSSRAIFHNTWKISNDGTVARSRKGLSFYTLQRK